VDNKGNTAAYNAVALCAVGAENAVSNEIKKLGLAVAESGFGRVRFRANITGLYRALMELRAADRVLLEAAVFPAADFDALFAGTENCAWEHLIPAHLGLTVVKVRSNRSKLKAETSIQAITHKAAAQRLCRAYGLDRLPEAAHLPEGAQAAEIRVYVEKDVVSLLLDLSGEPLFKRGYRKDGGTAPLRETSAAAVLLLSGWKRKHPLYDPFCGSGTILTEALMYAWDMAPGIGRNFALCNLLIADKEIEKTVRAELRGKINGERTIRIAGSDEDAKAVSLAKLNIERLIGMAAGQDTPGYNPAGIEKKITPVELTVMPMKEARPPFSGSLDGGFIVTNPPYGKRLGDLAASERLYEEMAALGQHFPQWKLALITSHPGFESFFGRKAHSCREMKGGPIPIYFFQYEAL
jgi:putative N6-adenine-specific DNA methylase